MLNGYMCTAQGSRGVVRAPQIVPLFAKMSQLFKGEMSQMAPDSSVNTDFWNCNWTPRLATWLV